MNVFKKIVEKIEEEKTSYSGAGSIASAYFDRGLSKALKIIKEHMKEGWTTVDKNPEEKGWYLVQRKGKDHPEDGYFTGSKWRFGKEYGEVIAWQELPENYAEEKEHE